MNTPARSNLATRLITAGIVAPLIALLLYLGPVWGWTAFILAAIGLSSFEFFNMSHPGDPIARGVGVLMTLGVAATFYWLGDEPRALLSMAARAPDTFDPALAGAPR